MIGNDVIDLQDPECRAEGRHARFDERVFGAGERARIAAAGAGDAERLRWTLWSAKESAYKAARKELPGMAFVPARLVARLDGEPGQATRATVCLGRRRYCVHLVAGAQYVHAVAHGMDEPCEWPCVALQGEPAEPAAPSEAVRRLAIAELAPRLGVEPAELSIRRRGRVPILCLRGRPVPADLSLSHHGRFVAFACRLASLGGEP